MRHAARTDDCIPQLIPRKSFNIFAGRGSSQQLPAYEVLSDVVAMSVYVGELPYEDNAVDISFCISHVQSHTDNLKEHQSTKPISRSTTRYIVERVRRFAIQYIHYRVVDGG